MVLHPSQLKDFYLSEGAAVKLKEEVRYIGNLIGTGFYCCMSVIEILC